ncbi:M48 family metallopeptidase [Undibacterium cyanobacteriorum]|uniref:M48 family metallopeptidase n=1 Tax=Undibacterium cyanobacteriorum TaxID=3073561 RepID=A0ABY9RIK9_9BURK|nr:M48 family metallopeptidase [Undibacterium sp. 20NA77.5]WMW81063.1 M48 family metallopeptidase [Undibacterium sp. 20NA77.5]
MKTIKLMTMSAMLALSASANAQSEAPQEGVKVEKMSVMRKLVPTGALEGQAAQQYVQTMREAQSKKALAPDNHPQVIRLRAIAKKLIPYALPWNDRAKEWQWEVNLLGSTQINAYCMPGGKIAFYTGILDTLKLTDDEVAIVMGHEIAHALREHGAERAGKSVAANIAVRAAALFAEYKGYDGRVVEGVGSAGASLAMLKFSRDDETEADIVGLDIAARAGYDPRAGVALWQKMGYVNKNSPPKWLSTHPAGKDRINEIRKHFPEVMPLYARAKGVSMESLPPYKSNVKVISDVR